MREDGHVLVIGAAGMDFKGRSKTVLAPATSNPGKIRSSFGGVGRNIAENLGRLEIETVLLTAVGDDVIGDLIMAQIAATGVDVTRVLQVENTSSGNYIAVLDNDGDLAVAVSDYEIIAHLTPEFLQAQSDLFETARLVVIDLNLYGEAVDTIVSLCQKFQVPLCVDPTSPAHADKITKHLKHVYLIAPNASEMVTLYDVSFIDNDTQAISAARQLVALGTKIAIVTMGAKGMVYADSEGLSGHIPAVKTQVVDSTGAGDAMTAAVIFGLLNELDLDESMRLGIAGASLTLHSRESVVSNLTADLLYQHLII